MGNKGFSLIEVLSPCPTNWKLSPVDAMKKIKDDLPGWGWLRDTEWRDGQNVPSDEIKVEFSSSKTCADFIEQVNKLQQERAAKKQAA